MEDNRIKIKFSAVNKSRRNDVPKHVKRILEEGDKVKHFLVVHNWISDEARRNWLTPPEKRNPPQKRETEREWSSGWSERNPATSVQYWIPNDDFFTVTGSQRMSRIYKKIDESGAEGNWFNSMVQEEHQYLSDFQNSDQILRNYPEDGDKW